MQNHTFRIQKGIKQGDTLSSYLFNLYLNDINKIFNCDDNCPPLLMSKFVGCLLYADDLFISQTEHDLQKSLNNLYEYCNIWKLQLNVRKTNIIIFNQRKQQSNLEFKFGSESIKIVDTDQYLGIKVHKNADFKCAVGTLKQKGHKAMFSLSQSLYTGITFNPDLPLKIFDHTIRPILTYGSEVWCFSIYQCSV